MVLEAAFQAGRRRANCTRYHEWEDATTSEQWTSGFTWWGRSSELPPLPDLEPLPNLEPLPTLDNHSNRVRDVDLQAFLLRGITGWKYAGCESVVTDEDSALAFHLAHNLSQVFDVTRRESL